jgi:hypothetical protein
MRLAVLSSSDLKVEVVGTPEGDWLMQIKKYPALSKIEVAGRYSTPDGAATVLRTTETGWLGGGKRDPQAWEKSAKTSGMNAQGRIAQGSLDKALALVDALYKTPAGISKIYLVQSQVQGRWTVTMQ